jgi:hypothetical protein
MGRWLAIVALGMAPQLAAQAGPLELPPEAGRPPLHQTALQLPSLRQRTAAQLASGQAEAPPSSPAQQPTPQPAPENFDLLEPAPKPDAATLARQERIARDMSRRRTMLHYHQVAGFATLASMTVAVALGQVNYLDKYAGGGDTGKFATPHRIAAYTAAGIFAATGLLAVLAPSPLDTSLRLDTATLHKAAMAVATAGLVTQIVLGIVTAHSEGSLSQRDVALAHQIVGYTTLAATAAGFFVLTF